MSFRIPLGCQNTKWILQGRWNQDISKVSLGGESGDSEGQIVNEESIKLSLVHTNYKKLVGPQLIVSSMAVELQHPQSLNETTDNLYQTGSIFCLNIDHICVCFRSLNLKSSYGQE